MSRIRLLAILGALSVVAAVAAPVSASAEPEFLTKAVVGEAVSSVPFGGTLGATFWEGKTSKSKITCSTGTISGEVTGPQSLANILLTLHGCETGGCPANSAGHSAGEVVSYLLAGKLGGITATLPGVKLFSQAEGKGGKFLQFEVCGGAVEAVMTGEVTGSLSGASGDGPPTGKLVSSMSLAYAEAAGKQKYLGFSEGPESGLMEQLTDTINGTPELNGLFFKATYKTLPSTWELGVTK
jgi:hypothetical protein